MKELQLVAVVLTAMMAWALITLLPPKVKRDKAINRSRWLLASGLLLLCVQFLLQYIFGFRQKGIAQAVMLNLALLIPTSALLALSIYNLQRQGVLSWMHKWIGVLTWGVAMMILGLGLATSEDMQVHDTRRMLWTEIGASCVFGLMQLYYAKDILHELKRMKHVLDDYFDREQDGLLRWMQISIVAISIVALISPFCIFLQPQWLVLFVSFVLGSICYTWFCFVRYVLTSAASRMREAEGSDLTHGLSSSGEGSVECSAVNQIDVQRIGALVDKWVAQGKHLRHDIRRDDAAREIGIPGRQLSNWVKASGYESYSQWITNLRIEEAKRLIREHRDWSVEAVADRCGISRPTFHRVFQELTGTTPAKFQ
jgi:AraC-like DNA-binding protein